MEVIFTALDKGFLVQDVIHKKLPGAVRCGNLAALRKSLRGGAREAALHPGRNRE